MKIKIRLEISVSMSNFAAVKKMEVIGCLVPELWSETHRRCERKFSRKRNVFTLLRSIVMSPYTITLRKIDSCSCKKAARRSEKTAGKDSGSESGGLYYVYRLKDNRIKTGSL